MHGANSDSRIYTKYTVLLKVNGNFSKPTETQNKLHLRKLDGMDGFGG